MTPLSRITSPIDLKNINEDELPQLCVEIREFLISTVLSNGGHFAGNLGVVELSVALHYVFNSPADKLIWDVGHQSYVHKIITGRKEGIAGIRNYDGLSGFPKIGESEHDIFGTGHSSTAISAASGIAYGESLQGNKKNKIIAIVGDGALTGGMSFEALNNLKATKSNVLVIINDNHIGIDPNNGAVDNHLQNINSEHNIFTDFGLPYFGPLDGHNVHALIEFFRQSINSTTPAILHIRTIKGKGYPKAEYEQTKWHSAVKFVKINSDKKAANKKWQDVFADELNILSEKYNNVTGITPAMPSGSGMIKNMVLYPQRFVDVGIAEQHAVTFAAGLSVSGMVPFLNIYSSFLQRGYDQLIHDVALQNLHVVFCVDRAGLVGEDGPTHHGAFDIAFLKPIPGIIICAPRNENEFRQLLNHAYHCKKPIAIRYPKGEISGEEKETQLPNNFKSVCLNKGNKVALIATGIASNFALQAAQNLNANISVFHFPFIKPINEMELMEILNNHEVIITVEDGCIQGGFGQGISTTAAINNIQVHIINLGIPDHFVTHGDNQVLYDQCGYSISAIKKAITPFLD